MSQAEERKKPPTRTRRPAPSTRGINENGIIEPEVQMRTLQSIPSRLDNRNGMTMNTFAPQVFARAKPKCNKRIRIQNGVTRFRDKGSFVRYECSHGYT